MTTQAPERPIITLPPLHPSQQVIAEDPTRYLSPGKCFDVASIMSYCWQRYPSSLICLNDPQWVDDCKLIRNYWS